MVSNLVIHENTYGSRAEASTYLADSPRTSGGWTGVPSSKKDQCLISATREIEKLRYQGSKTGYNVVDTVVVNAGGTTYSVADVITVATGTGVSASVEVLTLSGSAVATVKLLDAGFYSVDPDATSATTVAPVGGSGCTLDLVMKSQVLAFARTGLTDIDGEAVSSTVTPVAVKEAEYELAYLISQDSSVEGSTGTGENNKRLKAGSVEIERFKPSDGTRLPNVVHELLRTFLEGYGSMTSVFSSGTTVESQFDDDDTHTLTDGWP